MLTVKMKPWIGLLRPSGEKYPKIFISVDICCLSCLVCVCQEMFVSNSSWCHVFEYRMMSYQGGSLSCFLKEPCRDVRIVFLIGLFGLG